MTYGAWKELHEFMMEREMNDGHPHPRTDAEILNHGHVRPGFARQLEIELIAAASSERASEPLSEMLLELEGIQAGYEVASSNEARRQLDVDRSVCRAKIHALFSAASATRPPLR